MTNDIKYCYIKECKKKIPLVSQYPCKCGNFYCIKHKLNKDHNCKYDYYSENIKKIIKENPIIKKNKIEPI